MAISKHIQKRIVLIDLGVLAALLIINFFFQLFAFEMKSGALVSAIRNPILMTDFRLVNQTAVGMMSSSDIIYIQIPGQNRIERERKPFELELFDIEKQIKLFSDLPLDDSGQVVVTLGFSGLCGFPAVFIIWTLLNILFSVLFPLLRAQIERAIIEEQQKIHMQSLVDLSRQVAHDIRSPLSALEMALVNSNIPDDRKAILDQVAKRIRGIADDLLSQSRTLKPNLHQKEPAVSKASSVEVLPVLRQIIMEKNSTLKNFKINLECDGSSFRIRGSESDLGRAFSNLLNNSIEALTDDRAPAIEVSVKEYTNKVTVYIKDNGRGIPEQIVAKIGEPGFSFGKSNIGGNGLGVSYVKSKLDEWQGSLQILSKENEGTMIVLHFLKE